MSDNHNFDDDNDFFDDEYVVPVISRWKLLGGVLALVIVLGFGIGIWYAYDQGVKKGVRLAPPIIKADSQPVKEKPEDPGGMDIPNQDKKVFEVLEPRKKEEKVEKLMIPPEEVVKEAPPVDIAEDAPAKIANGASETLMAKPEEAIKETVKEAKTAIEAKKEDVLAEAPAKVEAPKTVPEKIVKEAAKKAEPVPAKTPVGANKPASVPEPATDGAVYRVQLGAFRSRDAAEKAWVSIGKKHRVLLDDARYRVSSKEVKGKGVFYRLQVGNFPKKADASDLCRRLKAEKQDCLVAKG